MAAIAEATAELDRRFGEELAGPGGHGPSPEALLLRSDPLMTVIDDNVGNVFRRLQQRIGEIREELVRVERSAIRWTALLLVVTPLFIAGAVLYLSRSVAQPLARLHRGAEAIAAGDLDARIDVDTPDEFGELAARFNAMTVALKQHQRRLVESETLAAVGRLAAGVAHELNNPLQVIIGYLSLHRDVPDRRLAQQLAAIEEEALRCKGIVEGLLGLSRPPLSPAPVDLRRLCDDVARGLGLAASPGGARVSVDGAAVALGDGAKLRQAVLNLMRNAVEAAGPAGEVEVRVGGSDHAVEVVVRDSGPGVSEEARARLFEPFFTTKPSGTGLGLAVSRAIALAHGGEIEIGGAAGQGAVFTLRLPAAGRSA
jgi:signal transduction histidine kinase